MIRPGFYFGTHDGCSIWQHHRHPSFVRWNEPTPQPREYLVTVPARIKITISVDLDGTIRLHDGFYTLTDRTAATVDDRMTFRGATLDDDLWDRLIDAMPQDGEIVLTEDFPRQPDPIYDEE